jgi:glycine/D-amino acid oxidase-like deaminating enzyme
MDWSFWERETWLARLDFVIIGSGIVGLNAALALRKSEPEARILILEKGRLPQGASTKNAGFACFGSVSELLSDLNSHTESEVAELVEQRYKGILALRKLLGDENLDFQNHGGHEVFLNHQQDSYQNCLERLPYLNSLLRPIFKSDPFHVNPNRFGFEGIYDQYITQTFEGQIHTGNMMAALLKRAHAADIKILNQVRVNGYEEDAEGVRVFADGFECRTGKLLWATNGFSKALIGEPVAPARAQVLVTHPIKDLKIKGTFHLESGYYYFRNIGNRILLGGGRNLDFKAEETTEFGLTPLVQDCLETLLREVILPHTSFSIDQRWSGIMGVGTQKAPIIKKLSEHVSCGIRLGGMGVAIGSYTGQMLAKIAKN